MKRLLLLLLLVGCATQDLQEGNISDIEIETSGATLLDVVPINSANSSFNFEGYTGAINQKGSFTRFEGVLLYANDELVGAEGLIKSAEFDVGTEKLNIHLASDAFLNIEVFPQITFGHSQIKDGVMTGDLVFLGIAKQISFPVEVTETGLKADFLLDLSPFGFGVALIDDKVRITFEMNS